MFFYQLRENGEFGFENGGKTMTEKKSILLNFNDQEEWESLNAYLNDLEQIYKSISPSSRINRSAIIRDLLAYAVNQKKKEILGK